MQLCIRYYDIEMGKCNIGHETLYTCIPRAKGIVTSITIYKCRSWPEVSQA